MRRLGPQTGWRSERRAAVGWVVVRGRGAGWWRGWTVPYVPGADAAFVHRTQSLRYCTFPTYVFTVRIRCSVARHNPSNPVCLSSTLGTPLWPTV
jgi:hypothetical protein